MERILTTVVGSWPRYEKLVPYIRKIWKGKKVDEKKLETVLEEAVKWAIDLQASASGPESSKANVVGIDILSDGEQSRFGYVDIVRKYSGFDVKKFGVVEATDWVWEDYLATVELQMQSMMLMLPGILAKFFGLFMSKDKIMNMIRKNFSFPTITSELKYVGEKYTRKEIERALRYLPQGKELVYTTPSPSTILIFYPYEKGVFESEVDAIYKIAKALSEEYKVILSYEKVHLQIDDPAIAMGYHIKWKERLFEIIEDHVRAINEAIKGLPKERIRLHVCYGNYAGPHKYDVDFSRILPYILELKVGTLLIEMANPRHQADVEAFEGYELDKKIAVSVIDVKTPIVEHPKVVKSRLLYASRFIDKEKLMATTDCGFGTFALTPTLTPKIAKMKLDSLVEGAYLASKELFG